MRAKLLRSQTALVFGACVNGLNLYVYMRTCVCFSVCVRVPIARRSNGLHGIGTDAKTRLMSHTYIHTFVYVFITYAIYIHMCAYARVFR